MSELKTLRKLRESHIPPYTYRTNFDREHLINLRDRITGAQFAEAIAQTQPINLYIHASGDSVAQRRRAMLATALVAKGLCLSGHKVLHCHLAGFLREQRMAEMERERDEPVNPVMRHIRGQGYIVISDFLEYPDVVERYGHHSMQLLADYLMEHIESGGGLVLGACDIGPLDVTQFGSAIAAMLDMFESFRV